MRALERLDFVIHYPATKKGKAAFTKCYGLNAYYAGKHWSVRNKDADYFHSLVRYELIEQGLRPDMMDGPVQVVISFDDGLDVDNHAVMGKYIIDALKGVCFEDDRRKFISSVTYTFNDENLIKVSLVAAT